MHSGNFSLFANDPRVTSLSHLTQEYLTKCLIATVPANLPDSPIDRYQVTNLRYKPGQKMVLGLTAPGSQRPLAVRIYPPGKLSSSLDEAREFHPDHCFAMPELDALVWVFPGERKLNLKPVADEYQLKQTVAKHRGLHMNSCTLVHYVPEHTYTACLSCTDPQGGSVTEYLKLHYNNKGAVTTRIMKYLSEALAETMLEIPPMPYYDPESRLMLQSALSRNESARLSDNQAAKAFARFHQVPIPTSDTMFLEPNAMASTTNSLVEAVFPSWTARIDSLGRNITNSLTKTIGYQVLIHGDAHLGNFFPLENGKVGIIDFDAVAIGEPEDDICSYFGFKLWLALRNNQPPTQILDRFPDFIASYNDCALRSVSQSRTYLKLAEKLLNERIRRGIARGKLSGENELASFVEIAEHCLDAAGTH